MHEPNNPPYIYLAPIRGITDALFREIFASHFNGFDATVAPFINPQNKSLFEDKIIQDVLPGNNPQQVLVPQLLHTDPKPFLTLASRLTDLGYTHINWNLGCPAPMVAKKKRGSGLLPYPDDILKILDEVLPKMSISLSIKTRLGFFDIKEILHLLPLLNEYPLKEIIIHTRLGKQLYKGTTNPDGFASCLELSRHTLVYNGDVNDAATYLLLSKKFQGTHRWMIGRGALANPFLAEQIKQTHCKCEAHTQNIKQLDRLFQFHRDLFNGYSAKLSGPSHILGRLKLIWSYLFSSFNTDRKYLKKIQKSRTVDQYQKAVERLFHQASQEIDNT